MKSGSQPVAGFQLSKRDDLPGGHPVVNEVGSRAGKEVIIEPDHERGGVG